MVEQFWDVIRVLNIFGGAVIGFGLVHLWYLRRNDAVRVYTMEIAVIAGAFANAYGAGEALAKDVPGDSRVLFALVFTAAGIFAVLRPNRLTTSPYHAPGLKPRTDSVQRREDD